MKKKIAVIGSGFSGLSAAAYASKEGHEVHLLRRTAALEEEPENLQQITATHLIWGPAGTGCPIL